MKVDLRSIRSAVALCFLLLLTFAARCWNLSNVFVEGKIFYADGDCYSRMTRVQQVIEHPGTIVHRQLFENWPEGTLPHTTAPFDYLTAALSLPCRFLTAHSTDLAGALVSPLMGVATAFFLWWWAGQLKLPWRFTMVFLFGVCPILVHGTVLGRPDHQSLLILCMALALGGEIGMLKAPARKWAITAGIGWGLGLWVSLYEPVILLVAAALGILAAGKWRSFASRERIPEGITIALFLLAATVIDGWQVSVPNPVIMQYFPAWSRTIGELAHVPLFSAVLLRWSLALLPLAPLALAWRGVRERESWFWMVLLVAVTVLTCWQARWGYFFGLVFVMALPWVLAIFPRRWIAIVLFIVCLWPVASDWDERLFPDEAHAAQIAEQRTDNLALYDVAQHLRGQRLLPVLAPWWQCPPLAYWSGQPCVAGSSHESLPGTVDTARFYLTDSPAEAAEILRQRKVGCVVTYEPARVLSTSGILLGKSANERSMAEILYTQPHSVPPFLGLIHENAAFRVFLTAVPRS